MRPVPRRRQRQDGLEREDMHVRGAGCLQGGHSTAGVGILTMYDSKMYLVFSHFLLTFSTTTTTTTTKHRHPGEARRERADTHTDLPETDSVRGVTAWQRVRRAHAGPPVPV